MSLQPYQFEPNSGTLTQQANGQFIASFELSYYEGQTLAYEDKGLNAQNLREIIVTIEGDETDPLKYRDGQTPPFTKLATEIGVELVAEKDKKREGSTIIHYL